MCIGLVATQIVLLHGFPETCTLTILAQASNTTLSCQTLVSVPYIIPFATAANSSLPLIQSSNSLTNRPPLKMSVHLVKDRTELQAAISDNSITVVDFFAVWCGPCKAVAPILEKWAEELTPSDTDADRPRVKFAKVDVDQNHMLATEHSVSAMPTFLIFYKSELHKTIVGANIPALRTCIDDLIAKLKEEPEPVAEEPAPVSA